MHTYPLQDNVWTGRLQLSPWRRPARRKSGSYLLLLICVIAPFQLVEYNHVKCHATIIAPHDDVIKWKCFPRNWLFVRGIPRSPVNSPHKGQWRGALMFSLICVWINGWVNNCEAGDLRRHRAHYDVTVITLKWDRALAITSTETPGLSKCQRNLTSALRWRHNGHDGVSNHQPRECLLGRLFGHRSKKTSKLCVTGLCAGNSLGTGEFPAQMASNAENVSIWWRHHGISITLAEALGKFLNDPVLISNLPGVS